MAKLQAGLIDQLEETLSVLGVSYADRVAPVFAKAMLTAKGLPAMLAVIQLIEVFNPTLEVLYLGRDTYQLSRKFEEDIDVTCIRIFGANRGEYGWQIKRDAYDE